MTIRCLLLRQPQRQRNSFSSANDDKKDLRTHPHIVKLCIVLFLNLQLKYGRLATKCGEKRTNTVYGIVVKDLLLDNFNCNILYVSMSSIIHLRGRSNEKDFK